MTEKLKHLLHDQADSVDFDVPDIHALTAAGDRTVRRRRGALAATAAALAVVVGIAGPQLLSNDRKATPAPAEPFPTQPRDFGPMFTIGPRVYDDGKIIRVDHWVEQAARTSVGFVYRSMGGAYSYLDGRIAEVGRDPDLYIESDQDGVLAGWLETDSNGIDLVILDQRDNATRRFPLQPRAGQVSADLAAIDGGTAYVYDERGSVAIDLATGGAEPVDREQIIDVENGVLAGYRSGEPDLALVTPDGGVTTEAGDVGVLSPDGAWYAADDIFPWQHEPGVMSTETGKRIPLGIEAGDGDMVIVTGWLDDATIAVRHFIEAEDRNRMLTCEVPSGRCRVVLDDLDEVPGTPSMGISFPGGGLPI